MGYIEAKGTLVVSKCSEIPTKHCPIGLDHT